MKKGIVLGIVGFVLLIVIWVAIVAANVGGEASKMDAMMKDDMKVHAPLADVKKQLADAGYTVQGDAPAMKAVGPKHSLIVYTTWLTLDLQFDENGLMKGYHLDRAS